MYGGIIRDLMRGWKNEAKVKYIVPYRLYRANNEYNDAKYKLTICTNHPGPFIGMRGALVEKYREKIAEVVKNKVHIEFVETTDIV